MRGRGEIRRGRGEGFFDRLPLFLIPRERVGAFLEFDGFRAFGNRVVRSGSIAAATAATAAATAAAARVEAFLFLFLFGFRSRG